MTAFVIGAVVGVRKVTPSATSFCSMVSSRVRLVLGGHALVMQHESVDRGVTYTVARCYV